MYSPMKFSFFIMHFFKTLATIFISIRHGKQWYQHIPISKKGFSFECIIGLIKCLIPIYSRRTCLASGASEPGKSHHIQILKGLQNTTTGCFFLIGLGGRFDSLSLCTGIPFQLVVSSDMSCPLRFSSLRAWGVLFCWMVTLSAFFLSWPGVIGI